MTTQHTTAPAEKMLTVADLNCIAVDAQIAFCLDKFSSYEIAFARGVEAAVLAKLAPKEVPAAPALTDEAIEAMARKHGARWSRDYWVIEDADLHPFVRSLLAAQPLPAPAAPALPKTLDVTSFYERLCDAWAEAAALGTANSRHGVLMRKLTKLRDDIGKAANCYIPLALAQKQKSLSAQEVKNQLCIDGVLNETFEHVRSTTSADELMCHLTELAHAAVDASFAALSAVQPGEQWIPVAERLPEAGQNVAFVVDCEHPSSRYLHGRILGGRYINGGFSVPDLVVDASHWRPQFPSPSLSTGEPK